MVKKKTLYEVDIVDIDGQRSTLLVHEGSAKELQSQLRTALGVPDESQIDINDLTWKVIALLPGQKVAAVKSLRDSTGLTLREAKDTVESWMEAVRNVAIPYRGTHYQIIPTAPYPSDPTNEGAEYIR